MESNNGLGVIGLIVLAVIGWFVYDTWIKKDAWLGMYEVPSANAIQVQNFNSREECEDWLAETSTNPGAGYNYECGKNCTPPTSEMGLYKCEETL